MNIDLLIATFEYIEVHQDEFASEFYSRLSVEYPDVYYVFVLRSTDMQKQKQLLMSTTKSVVYLLKNDKQTAVQSIQELGRRHQFYGVHPSYYDRVVRVFLLTLREIMKEAWTPEKEANWAEALKIIQKTMIDAYILS